MIDEYGHLTMAQYVAVCDEATYALWHLVNDGRTLEHYQPTRIGDPDAPLTDDQIADKFKELVVPVTGEAAAQTLLDACWSLDTLGSIRDLPFRIDRAAQAAE